MALSVNPETDRLLDQQELVFVGYQTQAIFLAYLPPEVKDNGDVGVLELATRP